MKRAVRNILYLDRPKKIGRCLWHIGHEAVRDDKGVLRPGARVLTVQAPLRLMCGAPYEP